MAVFGNAMLWGALATALLAIYAYVSAHRGNADARELGRTSFVVSGLAILAASVVLMHAFITGRYEMAYVAEYSSRALPTLYRVSAFWAGQEGSFLLWVLMGAAIGLALIRKGGSWESTLMALFTGTQAFLLLLLVAKSPFRPSPEALTDGHGLNPLLQDPWMAIHPPMIFLGYAALAVPFVFAVAALLRREYDQWVTRSLPWCLFSWVTLGAGVFIGGYWAYRVLGWGGYWGWDPVENASLIPWLLNTALLHGILLQRARGSLKRGNLALAILSFVMVLYGTFLTRSGVLSDFSVHSFAKPGMALYVLLLGGMVLSLVGPGILFALRARDIQTETTYDNTLSRDFAFFMGILVLCISATIVLVGTSAPILSSLMVSLKLMESPTSIQPGFYNRTHFPVAVLLGLLVAVAPILAWRNTDASQVLRRLIPHLVVAAAGTVVAFLVGVTSGLMLLLIGASVLCLSVSLATLVSKAKDSLLNTGAPLSHVGLALMLIGIVGSSIYSRSQKLTLQPGQKGEALGYQVTYHGSERPDETRREMKLTLSKGGTEFTAKPRMVFSPQMDNWVHSPAVQKYWLQDIYVSPAELRENDDPGTGNGLLSKGESLKRGGYTFTFERFDMSGQMGEHGMSVGAVIRATGPDGQSATVTPRVAITDQGFRPTPVPLPGTKITLAVVSLVVPQIELAVTGLPAAASPAEPKEEAVVEISSKPLINVLWLGTILILAGGLVATARRARETARVTREDEAAAVATSTAPSPNGKRTRDRAHARR